VISLAKRKKTNRRNLLPWIILAVIALAGAWYYYHSLAVPAPIVANVTPTGIQPGDLVSIDYVLTLTNGTVIDTNNETLAAQYAIGTYTQGPFRFIVGQSGKLKGFDTALVGMEKGQTAIRTIAPSENALILVKNLTRRVVRNQPYPRYRELSEEKFVRAFKKKPIVRDVVTNAELPFPFIVTSVENGTVSIEPNLREGQKVTLPGYEWESSVVIKSTDSFLIRHNPKPGQIITTEFGPARVDPEPGVLNITYTTSLGQEITYHVSPDGGPASLPYQFRVTDLTGTHFTLTRINYPAQETLLLTTEVLEWTPDVKEIKEPLKFTQSSSVKKRE